MKISHISWTNYKGLSDGSIEAHGNNVSITGRNGAGKSSIASILPFILFGKGSGSVKHYDDGIIPTDDGLIHAAEVAFDNGTSLRREYFWKNGGNHFALYINGKQVNSSKFKLSVDELTHGAGEFVINPFAFCNLDADIQREFLLRNFDSVSDDNLLAAEFPNLAEHLDGQSVDVFINRTKNTLKSLTTKVNGIPALIEENQRQIISDNVAADLSAVENELALLEKQHQQLSQTRDYNHEFALAQKQLCDLDRQINRYSRELGDLKSRRQSLLKDYRRVKSKGICPTCSQPLPADLRNDNDAILADIVSHGKQCNSEVEEHEKILADISEERRSLENQIARLQSDAQTQKDRDSKLRQLGEQINQCSARKFQLESQTAALNRIQTLRDDELNLIRQIDDLKHLLADAKNFRRRKIELVEDSINSRFKFVKFNLYKFVISTGEIQPTCEATLHGVPFSSLSHGEQLKAALDIFQTLQATFDVHLPIMLDDAESYTANSLVDIPNQIFAFKVTDDDLNIRVVTSCATNVA